MSNLPPLTLGPLMLPAGLWLSLLTLVVATAVWRRQIALSAAPTADKDTPLVLAGLGMLGSRVGFVGLYWREYLESPWTVINIRDGGWWWPAGVVAIALGAALLGWRQPPLRRPLLLSSVAAAVSALAVVAAGALSQASEARLPEIQVPSLAGELLPLHDGRPSVINLWASWCPPCRREMPVLVDGAQRFPDVRFVLLNQGEDQATVEATAHQWSIPPTLMALDPESAVGYALGVRGYPTTLIVAADGRILARHSGEVSRASLAALIESINADDRIIAEDQR